MGRVCLSINGYCQRALDDIINFLIGQFPFKARMVNHKKTGADMGFVLAYQFLEICCGLGIPVSNTSIFTELPRTTLSPFGWLWES